MIYILILCFGIVIYLIDWADDEGYCMAWVGSTEFEKNKKSMNEQDFKKYVKENSKKMREAMR